MQPLERAVAIFCIACICAELTTQLAGSTWARRCIKAVAGLRNSGTRKPGEKLR